MPATQFFLFLKLGRDLHTARRVEEIDINSLPAFTIERYEAIRDVFVNRLKPPVEEKEEEVYTTQEDKDKAKMANMQAFMRVAAQKRALEGL